MTLWDTSQIQFSFLNPILRGGFDQRCPDSVKSISGREILCKNKKNSIYLMCLMGYLGMFRKTRSVFQKIVTYFLEYPENSGLFFGVFAKMVPYFPDNLVIYFPDYFG